MLYQGSRDCHAHGRRLACHPHAPQKSPPTITIAMGIDVHGVLERSGRSAGTGNEPGTREHVRVVALLLLLELASTRLATAAAADTTAAAAAAFAVNGIGDTFGTSCHYSCTGIATICTTTAAASQARTTTPTLLPVLNTVHQLLTSIPPLVLPPDSEPTADAAAADAAAAGAPLTHAESWRLRPGARVRVNWLGMDENSKQIQVWLLVGLLPVYVMLDSILWFARRFE